MSTGRINPNSKVADVPLASKLFSEHKSITIKKLFGYEKAKEQEVRQRAAGALLHLVQDSHAPGHAERNKQNGDVKQFHSYEAQDEKQHGEKDDWQKGANLAARIKNTPGAERVIAKCAEVLVMLDQGASTQDLIKYLDEQVFKLDPKAQAAGPGAEFKKK